MPGSTEYECGECRHTFRTPEGAAHDTRLLMCPACGSIDLNLTIVQRAPTAVWTSREAVASSEATGDRDKSTP
jgi:DNA-directed RNA polymerase subunit RPC12/RpoP